MKQNEIWLINLDPTQGAEIKKIRPAIIVNDDRLGNVQKSVYFKNNEIKFSFERSLNFTLDLPSQDFFW